MAVGHGPAHGVGVAAAVTAIVPPMSPTVIGTAEGFVRIVLFVSDSTLTPGASAWNVTTASTPLPDGPAGGSGPSVEQARRTELAVTSGAAQSVLRPELPRNVLFAILTNERTDGSNASSNWYAPRSLTPFATTPMVMASPANIALAAGWTQTVAADGHVTGNETGVGDGASVGVAVGQTPGQGVDVGVAVGVIVGVAVGQTPGHGVGVRVGVGVEVGVGVGAAPTFIEPPRNARVIGAPAGVVKLVFVKFNALTPGTRPWNVA